MRPYTTQHNTTQHSTTDRCNLLQTAYNGTPIADEVNVAQMPNMTELTDDELHLYSRHLLLERWDIEAQQRLKQSKVLIVGAGGIGCLSSELLARAGVGQMCIVDFDTIEMSNLQRQTAFFAKDIGQNKAVTLASYCQNINPHIQVHAISSAFDTQFADSDFDLVLDGCDNFNTRYAVNRFCVTHRIPLLSAAAIGTDGQLLFVQGQPCYACLFAAEAVEDPRRCANSGVLTTVPNIMASLQAHHALLYLGLAQKPLLNRLLLWDGLTLQQRILTVSAEPQCPVCGLQRTQAV